MATENRARLRVKGTGYTLPFNGPASVLASKGGIVFPYTPTINAALTTDYGQYDLTHSNYPMQSFVRHRPGNISISAQFINQTVEDARYTAGVMHFLSIVMKMHFGVNDPDAGTPPPLLEFSAYGPTNFERVPVFVTNYNNTYPNDIDYVSFTVDATSRDAQSGASYTIQLPTIMNMTIELTPHYPAAVQNTFDLTTFSNGTLYSQGFI